MSEEDKSIVVTGNDVERLIRESAKAVESRLSETIQGIIENTIRPVYDAEKEGLRADVANLQKKVEELEVRWEFLQSSYLGAIVVRRMLNKKFKLIQENLKLETENAGKEIIKQEGINRIFVKGDRDRK